MNQREVGAKKEGAGGREYLNPAAMNGKQKIIIAGLARLTLLPEKESIFCFVEVKYRKNEK